MGSTESVAVLKAGTVKVLEELAGIPTSQQTDRLSGVTHQ
jgi:hypothetical protein